MAKATKKRKPWGSNRIAAVAADSDTVIVSGEPTVPAEPAAGSIGGAIEAIRSTLQPFDASTRKRIVKAANTFLR
ncbi:MAG TPA: hypothetical protein VNN80_03870 [Polyangiaceae bacterium]|nr:hypothetical protein [Polyangiaceae bacterium]HWP04473.1 hypothetical protein [Polyangiaceae bacterium]